MYRLGFADSRDQARQLVRHGHFALNGRRTDIPSALVKASDAVAGDARRRDNEYFKIVQEGLARKNVPRWLELDVASMSGRVLNLPGRDDIEVADQRAAGRRVLFALAGPLGPAAWRPGAQSAPRRALRSRPIREEAHTLVDRSIVAKVDALHMSEDFGRFQVEPLERGFGLTLGNALRRVLLSSLAGAAVTQVKVDGIYHEFATIPGVKEDTTELILNLKQLRLKSYTDQADPASADRVRPGHRRRPAT